MADWEEAITELDSPITKEIIEPCSNGGQVVALNFLKSYVCNYYNEV